MQAVQVKPPFIAIGLVAVGIALHYSLPLKNLPRFSQPMIGGLLMVVGFTFMLWAARLFRKIGTPIRPIDTATHLVNRGPFRMSRNPMYLGITITLIGITLLVGSVPMLVAPLGFFVIMNIVFVPHEERRLEQIFGDRYVGYKRQVRRWL